MGQEEGMMRRGLGLGRGKGYKNIQRRDSLVHSLSAKGVKQPQRISPFAARYSCDDKINAKINNPKFWQKKEPSKLPIYQINGKQYFRDTRLGEYRNVKDPYDTMKIDDVPNSMLQTPTIPYPEKLDGDSKTFDITTKEGMEKAEKYQQNLYKKYDTVKITPFGFEKVTLSGIPKEKIVGGLGDNRPDSDFDPKELKKGIKVEMEHTNNPAIAKEIAKDHETEFSGKGKEGYYDNLDKMEKKLRKEIKSIPHSKTLGVGIEKVTDNSITFKTKVLAKKYFDRLESVHSKYGSTHYILKGKTMERY